MKARSRLRDLAQDTGQQTRYVEVLGQAAQTRAAYAESIRITKTGVADEMSATGEPGR